jgi:hypothetical protein
MADEPVDTVLRQVQDLHWQIDGLKGDLKEILDRIDLANIPALAASIQSLRNVIERNVTAMNELRSRQIKTENAIEGISTQVTAQAETLKQILAGLK